MPLKRFAALQALVVCIALTPSAPAAEPAEYSRDIRPLLEQRCYSCHGEKQQLGGLDLTTEATLRKGGLHGPSITAGDPDASRLYRHVAGLEQPVMPLGGELAADEIASIRSWIKAGAVFDKNEPEATAAQTHPAASKPDQTWWAFKPPVHADPPPVGYPRLDAHPIDRFLEAARRSAQVRSLSPADRRTLIRRAYLDVHGLLPPPERVEQFVADQAPDAWARLVDELLDSPRYGERWGRHWLDVVRYADSSGYEHDYDYPNAWRYRDYVISAFNSDKPYDRFVIEQLAGDELGLDERGGFDGLIATGFYRIGPRILFREKDNPGYRYNYLDDMIATSSRAFMALSVDCARCHDHKFDPIQQLDYYRMMAVFFPHIRYEFPLASPEVIAAHAANTAAVEQRIQPLKKRIGAIEKPYRETKRKAKLMRFPQEIQDAVSTPESERSEGQRLLAAQVLSIGVGSVRDELNPADRDRVDELEAQIESFEKELPEPLPTAMGIRDGDYRSAPDGLGDEVQPGKGDREEFGVVGPWLPQRGQPYEPPPAHLLPTANYQDKGPVVLPAALSALEGFGRFEPSPPPTERVSTGRRLALAQWIASPDHPLTARVMVNRVWQHHFGRGLVLTASNFGRMGERASHPKLLDWLAAEFVASGWSVKAVHRLVMTSEAYRLSSTFTPEQAQPSDPENRLLWRYPTRRLEAEALRDITLEVAGNLNLAAGGKPFFPPIPQSVRDSFLKGAWEMTEPGPPVWRRSVYSYWKRGLRYPLFDVFDQPNMNVTCERRTVTTVPTQALTLLNNEFVLSQAALLAKRVRAEAGSHPEGQIERLYQLALSRSPSAAQLESNRRFLAENALVDLCHVVLNLNEFIYLP